MRAIIAYDKKPPDVSGKEADDPITDVLSVIIGCLRARKFLMKPAKQFFYTLNTTIEFEFPEATSKREIEETIQEIATKLEPIVQFRIGYCNFYGSGNKHLDQKWFFQKIDFLIMGN